MENEKRESEINLALLSAMADDPEEFGFTKAQAEVLMWADLYIRGNWNPDWVVPDEE